MLKYYNFDVVFQEIPNEVTLAINLTNCPNQCLGCHSAHLQQNIGEILDPASIETILSRYKKSITCVCFMGGDNAPQKVENIAMYLKDNYPTLKRAWYSGKEAISAVVDLSAFNYIKIGSYIEELGTLKNPGTNQKFFQIHEKGELEEKTHLFQ